MLKLIAKKNSSPQYLEALLKQAEDYDQNTSLFSEEDLNTFFGIDGSEKENPPMCTSSKLDATLLASLVAPYLTPAGIPYVEPDPDSELKQAIIASLVEPYLPQCTSPEATQKILALLEKKPLDMCTSSELKAALLAKLEAERPESLPLCASKEDLAPDNSLENDPELKQATIVSLVEHYLPKCTSPKATQKILESLGKEDLYMCTFSEFKQALLADLEEQYLPLCASKED